MKTYLSSELSCRFGNQNADSLIVDLGSATSVINDVVKNMAMSCFVVGRLDELSNQISDLNSGTVAVVSSVIAGNAVERTAYALVKDTELCGHWEAFTGNYSADRVYFSKAMQFAGNYTLGNRKTSTTSTIVYQAGLSSLQSIMFDMFTKRIQPTKADPAVSLTAGQQKAYEVGTKVTPAYSASCTKGSYTYDSDTGVQITGWSVTDTAGNSRTVQSGAFPEMTVGDATSYKITAAASHTAGNVAKDNLGDPSNPVVQIAAGTKSKATDTAITGYRKFFWGCLSQKKEVSEMTSSIIRGLVSSGTVFPATGADFSIPAGSKQYVFAAPAGKWNKNKLKLKDAAGEYTGFDSERSAITVQVEGLNGYDATPYDIWTYIPPTGEFTVKTDVKINWEE